MKMTAVAVFTLLGLAAIWDISYRKIPNVILVTFFIIGLAYQLLCGEIWMAVGGLSCGFALTLLPVLCRGMGMGDQKLLMAVGVWIGAAGTYKLFTYSIFVCLTALVVNPRKCAAAFRNLRVLAAGWTGHREVWLPTRKTTALALPFAIYLFASYVVYLLEEQANAIWQG
ncbi:prepilin peptidase [Brevibacillus sp. B_LB10_24]|uniref:A24 family peptidase n=1 Tax=Brevibacillus sp. B_LB10_24 TaxID=3380645 RepID=UPI0038B86E7E